MLITSHIEWGSPATSPSNGALKCRKVGLDEIGRTLPPLAHREEQFLSTLATFHQHLTASEDKLEPDQWAEDCTYLLCDLQLLGEFNPDYYSVEFKRNDQIGKVFINFDGLLGFYDNTPVARDYFHLLFRHQSVLDLIKDQDDLRRFVRRLPMLAAVVIEIYPELLQKIQDFRYLRKIIRYIPSKGIDIIGARTDLIKKPADLLHTLKVAPEIAPELLAEEKLTLLGFSVSEQDRKKCLQEAQENVGQVKTLRSTFDELNEGLEENEVFSILELAKINYYGDKPPFVVNRSKTNDFMYAGFYLTLADRILDRLDQLDAQHPDKILFERAQKLYPDARTTLQQLKKLYNQKSNDYLRKHPDQISLTDVKMLHELTEVEQDECQYFHEQLTVYKGAATEGATKERLITELVELPFDRVLRYSLRSDEVAALCAAPEMTFFWNKQLTASGVQIDPRDVLKGTSYKAVMGMWYLSHYEQWHLAGRKLDAPAKKLLDKAIEYGSGMAVHTRVIHLFDVARTGSLSSDQIRELLLIKDTAKQEFFTFGSVISGLVAFNFAIYCEQRKNLTATYKYIEEARVNLKSANFLEDHEQSMRELESFSVTVKELIESSGKGRTFNSYEQTDAEILNLLPEVQRVVVGGRCADEARRFAGKGYDPTYDRYGSLFAMNAFNTNIVRKATDFYDQSVANFNDQVEKADAIREQLKPRPKPQNTHEIYSQGISKEQLKVFHDQLVDDLEKGVTLWKALRNCTDALHAYREEHFSPTSEESPSRKLKNTGISSSRVGFHKTFPNVKRKLSFGSVEDDNDQTSVVAAGKSSNRP